MNSSIIFFVWRGDGVILKHSLPFGTVGKFICCTYILNSLNNFSEIDLHFIGSPITIGRIWVSVEQLMPIFSNPSLR